MTAHDTGVSTLWYSNNYGAILTTFALVRTLESYGKKVVVLDQSPLDRNSTYTAENSLSRQFMMNHDIACSEPLDTDEKIHALNDTLDTFVIGSDQVWRWRYTKRQGLYPFLDFVMGDKRKIAVSSSFGISKEERPQALVEKAKWYLKRFDAVSVREKAGLDILSQVYDVKGEWVLDPVFLCDKKVYDEVSQAESPESEPYLLTYVLNPDETIKSLIASVAAERGIKIISMADGQKKSVEVQQSLNAGDVVHGLTAEQWVNYIRHASFFVTDSFHGVCFSLLFERPFVCVAPPDRGIARFESLLELVGLCHRLLPPGYSETQKEAAMVAIDWVAVENKLNSMREKNLAWLQQALETPRSETLRALGDFTHDVLYRDSAPHDRDFYRFTKLESLERSVDRRWVPFHLRCSLMSLRVRLCFAFTRLQRRKLKNQISEQRVLLSLFLSSQR